MEETENSEASHLLNGDAENNFVCLFSHCMCTTEMLIDVFAHFLIQFPFLLSWISNSLYILCVTPLEDTWYANIFYYYIAFFFLKNQ